MTTSVRCTTHPKFIGPDFGNWGEEDLKWDECAFSEVRHSISRSIAEMELRRDDVLEERPSGEGGFRLEASGYKVLIVDDERMIADTLAIIFSNSGYEVRVSYSAEQAIEIFAGWLPDLAILDVVLPSMNGIDLAMLLAAQYPTCKTLLFSGQSLTIGLLAEAAQKGNTFALLAKPTHPDVMLETALTMLTANRLKQIREAAGAADASADAVDLPA